MKIKEPEIGGALRKLITECHVLAKEARKKRDFELAASYERDASNLDLAWEFCENGKDLYQEIST